MTEEDVIEEKKNGGTIVSRYQKGRFLGKGGFARCYEVTQLDTNKQWAMKIISKETLKKAKAKQKLLSEIKIHKSLNHKNIIHFDHVFEDTENVYIVLELCPNHTLNELVKRRKHLTENEVQHFLIQIINGFTYLHSSKIIHRDLKLGNLMLGNHMEIKIGDFGLAAKLETQHERRKTICGTPNYLAPEILNNSGHSFEVDVWSLGVVMYTLLYGRPPFETSDIKKTYHRIKEGQYTFNEEITVSIPAKNLISKILIVDPVRRLTLEQILNHPFMCSVKVPNTIYMGKNSIETNQTDTSKVLESKESILKNQEKNEINGFSERMVRKSASGIARHLLKKNEWEGRNQNCKEGLTLANNFFTKSEQIAKNELPQVTYVRKWVDYSSKYGLGYLLSDGSTGIYFNDATKMVIDPEANVDYVYGTECKSFSATEPDLSKEINKKLTLLQYFRKYLATSAEVITVKKDIPFVYLKKFAKSEEAILFRLNNRIIQVNFNDKSQMMIHCELGKLQYTCGKEKVIFDINTIANKREIAVKIEHMKLLLRKITNEETENS